MYDYYVNILSKYRFLVFKNLIIGLLLGLKIGLMFNKEVYRKKMLNNFFKKYNVLLSYFKM